MNDTVSMEVRDYVAGVRAALADLPAEDVEEFTTGMEADLAERLAEPGEGSLRDRLGEPDAYAAELRSAAGLPPRAAVVLSKKPVAQRLSELWSDLSSSVLSAMPWLSDLRPLWWAVRGFALAALPALMIGVGVVWLGTFGALASVAAGLLARQGKLTGGWVRPTRVIGNIAAVLLLPFAFVLLVDGQDSYSEQSYAEPHNMFTSGISSQGNPVSNLYAYDEEGRRIDKVRIFDENGRELKMDLQMYQAGLPSEEFDRLVDPLTGDARIPTDVFPIRWDGRTGWERLFGTNWEPPVAITPLPGPVPSVEASVSPSPTVTATTTPTPSASPTSPGTGATATPTPTATSR